MSGDRPMRRASGLRKSGTTPASQSRATIPRNDSCVIVTWLPRSARIARGVATVTPSGTSQASTRSNA